VTGGSTTTFQAVQLTTRDTYDFRVIAVNDVGQSLPSQPTSLVIATIPLAPSMPTKVSSLLTTITIEWDEPESDGGEAIQNYVVKMESIEGDGYEVIGYTTETIYLKDGLISGREYYFVISAVNSVGQSPDSPAQMIICGIVPGQPPKPTLLSQSDAHVSFSYKSAAS